MGWICACDMQKPARFVNRCGVEAEERQWVFSQETPELLVIKTYSRNSRPMAQKKLGYNSE